MTYVFQYHFFFIKQTLTSLNYVVINIVVISNNVRLKSYVTLESESKEIKKKLNNMCILWYHIFVFIQRALSDVWQS